MSGTQTLFEAKITPAKTEREALLAAIAAVPTTDGRVEITETKTRVDVRAFFSVDAEARTELLVEACRAAAALGAKGAGVFFVLVDFQRESGSSFVLDGATCVLTALSNKEARAKHGKLDQLLEEATVVETASESDPALLAAAEEACTALAARSKEELAAAFARVKATTITTAAFGVSKKQEKTLPRLKGTWFWREALPVRLYAELDPKAAEPMVTALLESATLVSDERFMLLEAISRSPTDEALAIVVKALDGDALVASAARRALAFSAHPRAAELVVARARAWLEATTPETLPYQLDSGAIDVLASLELRNDGAARAMLFEIWQWLFERRARIPTGAYAVPNMAAQTYAMAMGIPEGVAIPGPRAPLEAWAEVIAKVGPPR